MEDKYLFCQDCNVPRSRDFNKVAYFRHSGLVIYVHKWKDSLHCDTERRSKYGETYILHNTSCNELKKAEYICELGKFQSKCFQCKGVVQRVRNLLDELMEIKENQIIGICEHCKLSKSTKKCPRCEYILNKFLSDKIRQCEERQRRFKVWLCRVRHLLQEILEGGSVCYYKVFDDPYSNIELKYLLQQLKAPLAVHEPICDLFTIEKDVDALQNLTESKEIIEELIMKLQPTQSERRYSSETSLNLSPSKMCICKYFMDNKFLGGPLPELDFGYAANKRGEKDKIGNVVKGKTSPDEKYTDRDSGKTGSTGHRTYKLSGKSGAYKTHKDGERSIIGSAGDRLKGKERDADKKLKSKEKIHQKSKGSAKEKAQSPDDKTFETSSRKDGRTLNKSTEMTEEEKIFFNLLQEFKTQKREKQVGTPPHKQEIQKRPIRIHHASSNIGRKTPKSSDRIKVDLDDTSYIECDHIEEPPEMIKGTKIVPYHPQYKKENKGTRVPLLFEIYSPDYACPEPEPVDPTSKMDSHSVKMSKSRLFKTKGAFSYALSDTYFIEKGITKLPTEKIMRKMNIYRMEPTDLNWFERNKLATKYYNTGEILAEVNEDGYGKWFYKNSAVALDYYNTEESNIGQRYVVYSTGKDKPQTVLASFDYLGNGVVYDHNGNIRLKYNQSEGLMVDEKIAPPGKWKWHTLNEPPVLQRIFINTNLKPPDPILQSYHDKHEPPPVATKIKDEQEALMLTIEFDNFVKEKANKLLQKFKPFQIRMKAVKLNEQFSLKILDQGNIRLFLRDGANSLKVNVGMVLISNEIINTDTAEVSEVSTPYDKVPPKSQSIENIQRMIQNVRKEGKQSRTSVW